MQHIEIIQTIEKTAPLAYAAAWDVCGVQVAAFRTTVSHVAVILDPTLAAITTAIDAGADFIMSHHPLSMKPRFPNQPDEYLKTLTLLLARKVWLYSAHTSLDANPEGPVRWLAHELGLSRMQVLEPTQGEEIGFGFVGDLSTSMEYTKFCDTLAKTLGKAHWQSCGVKPATIRRVACCPGSGSGLAKTAAEAKADVFVTGDVKYHAALESPLRMLDVGHFCLENEMMRRFAVQLQAALSVPVTFFPGSDPLHAEGHALCVK